MTSFGNDARDMLVCTTLFNIDVQKGVKKEMKKERNGRVGMII
jgi:hypothetical protein